MNGKERLARTFKFEPLDGPAIDLMENAVWVSLYDYFERKYGFTRVDEIWEHLHCDVRWAIAPTSTNMIEERFIAPEGTLEESFNEGLMVFEDADASNPGGAFLTANAPLAGITSIKDCERIFHPDPEALVIPDVAGMAKKYPGHALVFSPMWIPLFCGACEAFGFEDALTNIYLEKGVIEAYLEKQTEYTIGVFERAKKLSINDYCDYVWLADDIAGQNGPLISPEKWRELFKPYLERIVSCVKSMDMKVLFHCCGAAKEFIGDFIDIGIDAFLVVQTSARGMVIEDLAKDFGGKIVFWGAVDAQKLLVDGSPEMVRQEVDRNWKAFERCGGYVVSNSHHCMPDIKGENIEAMCDAAFSIREDKKSKIR